MKEDNDEDSDDDEPAPLDWEPQQEELPNDLQQVLARHTAGTLVLDARFAANDQWPCLLDFVYRGLCTSRGA